MRMTQALAAAFLAGLVLSIGCNGGSTPKKNQASDPQQSDDQKARSELERHLAGHETADLKFKNFDISRTNSITSPYEATVMCEVLQDGTTCKAIGHYVYRDGRWSLVNTRAIDP
jgi:hypothetical protein